MKHWLGLGLLSLLRQRRRLGRKLGEGWVWVLLFSEGKAFGEVGVPSFAEVLRSKTSFPVLLEVPTMWLGDPLGKDHFAIYYLLGKPFSVVK